MKHTPATTKVLRNSNNARQGGAQDVRCISVLSIAGSDSGGGAGIQADLKTFAAFGVHGLTAITAITAQDTRSVHAAHPVPTQQLQRQLEAVAGDFRIGAVKIGMLGSTAAIGVVARFLRELDAPVVLDPVLVSSSGTNLLPVHARRLLREQLVPLARLLTPNLPEAAALLERRELADDAVATARELLALGAEAVLLKGGHGSADPVVDTFVEADAAQRFRHRRLPFSAHGTGCVLSAAIAAGIATGLPLHGAVQRAERYLQRALRAAYRGGHGAARILATPRCR